MFQEEKKIPKAMVKYASGISLESIVDILAEVTISETPILSATIKTLELSIKEGEWVSECVGERESVWESVWERKSEWDWEGLSDGGIERLWLEAV